MYYVLTNGGHPFDTGPGCIIDQNVRNYKKRENFDSGLVNYPGASSVIQRMINKERFSR